MKLIRSFAAAAIALATLTGLVPSGRAASVGPAGYTNHFSSLPATADWSYLTVAGATGDITTAAALNTAVQASTATGITRQVVSDNGDPPAAAGYATWSPTGGYLQTRPADVKFMALMATLINNTGADQKSFQIGYTFSQQAITNEEINGHLVYYSLTGAAKSWTNVPALSSAAPGNLTATISSPWSKGGALYLLWADDKGSPSRDTANQIHSFFVNPTQVPPFILSLAPMSATVSLGGPASFTVTAAGTPPLSYQWRKVTAASTNILPNQTNATYSIAAAALDDAAGYCVVITNAFGSVTSAVATLSVIKRPTALGLNVLDRKGLYVFFSTNMDAVTALDASRYHINHGITVTNAAFVPSLGTNGTQSVVRLNVQPLLGFFPDYSLAISNVFGAGGLLPIMPNPTVLPFHLDYRNLGYLYLSPLPEAEYVCAQTRFVLVRFKDVSPNAVTNLSTFVTVTGSSSGIHSGETHVAMDGRTVIYQMTKDFSLDESVTVSLAPHSASSSSLDAYQYQFVVGGHIPDVGTITARGDNPPYQGKENAFDGDPATKWLDYIVPDGTTNFSWIQYLYPDNATLVAGQYALTSADDAPEDDPADWSFYGVDASGYLTLLDRQTGQRFSSRYQTKTYTLTNSVAFRGYRLEITRVNDASRATAVQLAELGIIERQGTILREYWLGIPGTAVSDLTGNINYPANPSGNSLLSSFEAPINWAVNYGTRVRGYITAPNTGTYVFWISSDDNSELWLSTNDNPANKSLIASVPDWTNPREWTKYSQQQSASITLTAGQKYYVEALQKDGGGGDNLAVGWAKPGQGSSAPSEVIPGEVLSPWTGGASAPDLKAASLKDAGLTPKFATMPNGVSVPSDFPQVMITARGNPASDYIWLENVGQNGQMYKMILDTWGNPVFYQRGGAWDFKRQKNGLITWAGFAAVDKNFNYVTSYFAVNGYGTDNHELQVMEDGTYFLIGVGTEAVDMSRYVAGGNPTALVLEDVVQQFTPAGELIFQWRAWDHLDILGQQPLINLMIQSFDFPHMNAIDVDDDGHILVSSRNTSECTKINRDTGEIIWRLGGTHSTLTFFNDPLNGPRNQHGFRALGRGHYILGLLGVEWVILGGKTA
jgi:hypothetical protein